MWFTYKKHYDLARCHHPKGETEHINYVTGESRVSHIYCEHFRALGCGPEGKYWEPCVEEGEGENGKQIRIPEEKA